MSAIWPYILVLFLLGGGGGFQGVLANIRSFLWIRVEQGTARVVSPL